MSLINILFLAALGLIAGRIPRARGTFLFISSLFVIYWLQPTEAHGGLAFWLPSVTLVLITLCWLATAKREAQTAKENLITFILLIAFIFLVDFNRYFDLIGILPVLNPRPINVVFFIAFLSLFVYSIIRFSKIKTILFQALPLLLLTLFVILKIPNFAETLLKYTSLLPSGESEAPLTLSWLGFSYIAFRLLHTLQDARGGRLPETNLQEYFNYVLFFPALTAGPIDRIERFIKDLRHPAALENNDWVEAGKRLSIGLAKKFILADLLALLTLDDRLAGLLPAGMWAWFFLYLYSLRIYFDFSGYTDIAIGIARFMGIRLPENFNAPYLKPNLTLFWNAWHMTLTQWFRAYFFNPFTRWLRIKNLPAAFIIFITQIATMLVIGLWHGITWNFALWGVWHGIGLFVQNRWSEYFRQHPIQWMQAEIPAKWMNAFNIFLTFNYVSIGWLFFSLSSPSIAFSMLMKLFGAS